MEKQGDLVSEFIRSNQEFPCPKCGISVYIYYYKDSKGGYSALPPKWDVHQNDDGRCKQSNKKVLNPGYIRKGKS